jgi:hypothetical protein
LEIIKHPKPHRNEFKAVVDGFPSGVVLRRVSRGGPGYETPDLQRSKPVRSDSKSEKTREVGRNCFADTESML